MLLDNLMKIFNTQYNRSSLYPQFIFLLILLLPKPLYANNLTLLVLGVAQDAGYPQAGCYKPHCMPGWKDRNKRLGATSLAIIDKTNQSKFIFDATPQFPEQLYQLNTLSPDEETKLNGIFLTHAHIGHYTGLMFLGHEAMGAKQVPVYAMPKMSEYLNNNGPWSQLVNYQNIKLKSLTNNGEVRLGNLSVTPFIVPHRDEYSETVGYRIEGPSKSALFIPDINKWHLWQRSLVDEVAKVDYAFIDATFYADGEIPGRSMADIPHPFVIESMAVFKNASDKEKAKVHFIHMNHTNPLLDEKSKASQKVVQAGFNIARTGLTLSL